MKKIFVLFFFLTSCAYLPPVGENYKKPESVMPSVWNNSPKTVFEKIEQQWWKNFHDPILNQIIEIAIKNNYDYKIAQSRVMEARANVALKDSDYAPKITGTTSASRRNTFINPINPDQHMIFNLFTAGFDATWELDLFGSTYRASKAAEALFEASDDAKNYVLISLIAEVVKNYSDLRASQNQLFFSKQINAIYQDIFEISQNKKAAGLLSDIDLAAVETDTISSEKDLADAEARVALALYNLEFLLGKRPGEMKNFFGEIGEVPLLEKNIFATAPAAILQNRPDIRQAEREFASAFEMKNYSIAEIFPKISLSGFLGFYNTKPNRLVRSNSRVFSSGAQIDVPLLNLGVFAGIKISEERKKQALLTYEEKINQALVDVESSMVNFSKEKKKFSLSLRGFEIYKTVNELNQKRYNQGLISDIELLKSRAEFLRRSQLLNDSKFELSSKTAALYKSLGGGWNVEEKTSEKLNKKPKKK
jgi:multidrug efflux system outer membrane protein